MWTRKELKNSAKDFLRENYKSAFIVCLIVILLTSTHISTDLTDKELEFYMEKEGIVFMSTNTPIKLENMVFNFITSKTYSTPIIFISSGLFLFLTLAFILFNIFIGPVLLVGQAGFFLKGFKGDVNTKNLWPDFKYRDEYFNIVQTIFIRNVYLILWILLLVIPGIIKAYEYRMVTYILANEGIMSPNEVITRSREMTKGHKWDIFVLDLSFILWDLLGYITFGLGGYFVAPYKEATFAKLYEALAGLDEIEEELVLE